MENGVSSEGPPAYSLEDPNSPVSESWEPVVSEPHSAFPLVPRHPASARPLSLAGRASTAGPSSATPLNLPSSSRPPPSIRTRSAPTTGRSFTPRPFSDTQWSAPNRSASFPSRSTPLQSSRRVNSSTSSKPFIPFSQVRDLMLPPHLPQRFRAQHRRSHALSPKQQRLHRTRRQWAHPLLGSALHRQRRVRLQTWAVRPKGSLSQDGVSSMGSELHHPHWNAAAIEESLPP